MPPYMNYNFEKIVIISNVDLQNIRPNAHWVKLRSIRKCFLFIQRCFLIPVSEEYLNKIIMCCKWTSDHNVHGLEIIQSNILSSSDESERFQSASGAFKRGRGWRGGVWTPQKSPNKVQGQSPWSLELYSYQALNNLGNLFLTLAFHERDFTTGH